MVARSIVAMCVMTALEAMGCSAPLEGSEADEAASEDQGRLGLHARDDVPVPDLLDRALPALDRRLGRPPAWELRRYLEEWDYSPRSRVPDRCYQYDVKVYDPGRGREITVPVTVCN